ncbi:MAG TPA: enoyl-CoA hydratase [Paracoccaceae bacterium]|nr:enoyl-CoA hydratase [Paracoccaceae bacterium]
MSEAILIREDDGAIATLTLNDPDRLNVLSDAMLAALQAEIDRLSDDQRIRVVILAGAGRAFCAGHDLREMQAARQAPDGGRSAYLDLFERCSRVMLGLTRLPQPVIARVHGIATAAGCQLVASCDLAVAAHGSRFGVNGVNIGLFCSTPMVALTRAVGRKRAFEMLVTGEFVEAEEAARIGLVNRTVPESDLAPETRRLAETIAGKLGPVVAIGKRAFYDQAALDLDEAYAHAGAVMTENMLLPDTQEGIAAFIEKRAPVWKQ